MASERTQSRRKRCIFRRAFCQFRTCERKPRAGCPGAYEIRADSSQDMVGRWVSLDSVPDPQQTLPENMNSCLDASGDARAETPLTADHQLDGIEELGEDPLHLYFNRIGSRFLASDLPPHSLPQVPIGVAVPHPRASSPLSPNISIMEMDVAADVDPETGERALG